MKYLVKTFITIYQNEKFLYHFRVEVKVIIQKKKIILYK